ncbi:hypothetical protein J2Z62_000428 [Mycoplasmoides fastidiosum]|uniref:Uncharacterized protein n=1 Tax=Mycoplasmoides fastidiosum TaxID=92758 RepID=A0ABU0LZH5_9BACT|nr:hypothetical protein [Mycoplasmoides fastidiosum]MDQ0513990.1 hypothetical protein [Mycoplasmoides fastidiosum]UUD37596.1 hypothetical protein NPA10_03450 [Mycoplasmoides fastidiosum]
MKKFNLFKKNKLWLASLGIATTSSLVLAACASQTQGTNNNTNTNSGNPDNQNGNSGTETPKEPATPLTPAVPEIKTATAEQKALATVIVDNPGVKKVLEDAVTESVKVINAQLTTISKIDNLNQTIVTDSVTALGKADDPAAKEATSSVIALVKTLKANVTAAAEATFEDEQKTQFTAALDQVIKDAAELLTALNSLPKANDAKKLVDLQAKLKTALDELVKTSANTELTTKLKAVLDARDAYQAEVKVVAERLVAAEQKAFVLDSSTSALSNYANTKVAAFLTTDSKHEENTTTLNHLVTRVRSGVLGTLGADLWTVGNISETVAAQNRPSSIAANSTSDKLYAIVVGLAEQQFASNTFANELKSLTYNQSLLLKADDAINLLGSHVEQNVPVDVARLNAYLVTKSANVVELLQPTTGDSIKSLVATIDRTVKQYTDILIGTGTEESKLAKELAAFETSVTETDKNTQKAKIKALVEPAKALGTKLQSFKTELEKLQKLLVTVNTTDATKNTYPLIEAATKLNQTIAVSKNYGDVLQVVGKVEILDTNIDAITKLVQTTGTQSALMKALDALVDEVKDAGAFGSKLKEVAAINDLGSQQAELNKITNKTTGYVYTDLVDGKTAVTTGSSQAPAKLSFAQFKTELEKLQTGTGKLLTPITTLLNNQLRPSETSQTAVFNKHLTDLFNNGNVLPDTENH